MHNHNDNNSSSMMWMMAICCLVPLVFLLIAGKGLSIQGLWGWLIVAAALAMFLYHFWQMRKRHGGNQRPDAAPPEENKNSPDQLK